MSEWFADVRVIWFMIGLGFFLGEIVTPGVILMFFGTGAWVTMLCLFIYPVNITFQLAVFLSASLVSLAYFRVRIQTALYKKPIHRHNSPSSLQEEIIGYEVDVIEDINPPHTGRVMLHGASWQASAGQGIAKGSRVKILHQEGLVLTVKRVGEPQ